MSYLQFTTKEDLFSYLNEKSIFFSESKPVVHLDMTERHVAAGAGQSLIVVSAVFSQRTPDGACIAVWGTRLHEMLGFEIQGRDERAESARRRFKQEIAQRLDGLRVAAQESGFHVVPGVWTEETPRYLKDAV